MVFSTFFIGSCRYRDYFPNYFPPVLHSTKEIRNFLQKYVDNTLKYENNVEFGDALHPLLRKESLDFIQSNTLRQCTTLVVEISTRKVAYAQGSDIPLNVHYVQYYGNIPNYDIRYLTDEEMKEDILAIQTFVKTHFHISNVLFLPVLNLRLRDTGHYVPERLRVYKQIKEIPDIHVVDLSKFFETSYSSVFLDDIQPDGYAYSPAIHPRLVVFFKEILSCL